MNKKNLQECNAVHDIRGPHNFLLAYIYCPILHIWNSSDFLIGFPRSFVFFTGMTSILMSQPVQNLRKSPKAGIFPLNSIYFKD